MGKSKIQKANLQQDCTIVIPPADSFVPVRKRDWKRLCKKIKKLGTPNRIWENIGYSLLAISGSACIAAITIHAENNLKEERCWWITACAFIIGIVALLVSRHTNKKFISSKDELIEELQEINEYQEEN